MLGISPDSALFNKTKQSALTEAHHKFEILTCISKFVLILYVPVIRFFQSCGDVFLSFCDELLLSCQPRVTATLYFVNNCQVKHSLVHYT